MGGLDYSLVDLLFKLLPGLMAAAVFHSITPYPKRDVFDRIVNALIFTAVGQMAVGILKPALFFIGEDFFSFGNWTEASDLWVASIGAVASSVFLAFLLNTDRIHIGLRYLSITKRVALPSPWYSAHARFERYVTLTLKDGRRALGWPKEWPDTPNSGHYVLTEFEWLVDGGKIIMYDVEAILINAADVEYVEFMRFGDDEVVVDKLCEIKKNREIMFDLNQVNGETDES